MTTGTPAFATTGAPSGAHPTTTAAPAVVPIFSVDLPDAKVPGGVSPSQYDLIVREAVIELREQFTVALAAVQSAHAAEIAALKRELALRDSTYGRLLAAYEMHIAGPDANTAERFAAIALDTGATAGEAGQATEDCSTDDVAPYDVVGLVAAAQATGSPSTDTASPSTETHEGFGGKWRRKAAELVSIPGNTNS